MPYSDYQIFVSLMQEVYQKALAKPFDKLNFSDREFLSDEIEVKTGYKITGRTLAKYVNRIKNNDAEEKLPNRSTLDILARYVLIIPHKSPPQPKSYKYWHEFRKQLLVQEKALFKPKTIVETPKNQDSKKKIKYASMGGLSLVLGMVFFVLWIASDPPLYFQGQIFQSSNLDSLKKHGWFLINEDINRWVHGDTNKCLIMETHQGDSWLDDPEHEPILKNILTHEFSCGECCEIVVKMKDFHPNEAYQQAGFFVFYGKAGEEVPSLRFTYNGAKGFTRLVGAYRQEKYQTEHILHDKTNNRILITSDDLEGWKARIDSIVLKLRIEGDLYSFSRKVDDEDYIYVKSLNLSLPKPTYVGLAAFAGFALVKPVIPIADSIPAHFEYIRILPCGTK